MEKSNDPKFNRKKTVKHNPKKVSLEDVKTGEIKTFTSINKAAKFTDQPPSDDCLLGWSSLEE